MEYDENSNNFCFCNTGAWELEQVKGKYVDQVIRPTGLIDPPVEVRPAKNQVDDLMHECKKTIEKNYRVLVTTLTKKMAEDLTEYLHENGIKVRYMHSDIDTLERIEIMRDLRMGVFDVLGWYKSIKRRIRYSRMCISWNFRC